MILMGLATVALIWSIVATQGNHGRHSGSSASSRLNESDGADDFPASPDEASMRSMKSDRIRPSAEELARKRRESHRIELVRKLQMMSDGGLSDRHPSKKAILDELAKAPDIRTQSEDGGTYVLWTRDATQNGFLLIQYQFAPGGTVSLKTIHRTDPNGAAMSSKIFDDKNQEIFKVSYGYRKSDGRLVEERVFDSRERLLNVDGTEVPLRRVIHSINADDGSPESNVVDSSPRDFPPQMKIGFNSPFLPQ